MAEWLRCTPDEAKRRLRTSRDVGRWKARFDLAPFGQEALAEQIAFCVCKILRALGDDETDLAELKLSPFEYRQRDADVDDLDDDEIDALNEEAMEDLERDEQKRTKMPPRHATLED